MHVIMTFVIGFRRPINRAMKGSALFIELLVAESPGNFEPLLGRHVCREVNDQAVLDAAPTPWHEAD